MTGVRPPRLRSQEERELSEHFANEYRQAQAPVILELEQAVCGCDYGGTSWTTREEAESMGRLMGLAEGRRLLEIGAGSGWPALYLAGLSGCHATLADLPQVALRIAADRVASEALDGEIFMTVADGACLPFKQGHFDAISHSDVLCCLAPKREALDECRRVICDDGKMAFTVIAVSPGLSCADHARAVDCGPPFVEAECEYPKLLETTGWNVIDRIDVTAAYGRTGALYIREAEARTDEMRKLLGKAEYDDLLAKRKRGVQAAADRIVLRHMFLARPL